jgi:hypothetical protein
MELRCGIGRAKYGISQSTPQNSGGFVKLTLNNIISNYLIEECTDNFVLFVA